MKIVFEKLKKIAKLSLLMVIIFSSLFGNLAIPKTQAALGPNGFKIQTGYYMGSGAPKAISGLGFAPDLVIIKSDTNTIATIFKTKYMISNNSGFLGSATADDTAGRITLEADGFTVISTPNTAAVRFTWIAYGGSDCTSVGTFCVGSYIGNGTSPRAITIGFQPDLVVVKRSTAVNAVWRTSSMATNVAQFFSATAEETGGANFTTLDATGFTVGATTNTSSGVYYFFAFKAVSGAMNVGTYTGNATDNTNITGAGFVPDFVFLKNADAAVPVAGVMNTTESYGDYSSLFSAAANATDHIQALQTDGFKIGTASPVNGSGNSIFWAAFDGAAAPTSSGTFSSKTGSYTGTGANQVLSGLSFKPDLVIIKGNSTVESVFRTSMMGGDTTAYLGAGTANFTNGIISLNTDGFTVGTDTKVNGSGTTYYWEAYGNAWNPETNSGASDFYVGAFMGNAIDSRNITRLPFQADLVTVKRSGATIPVFRTSAMVGDLTGFYTAAAEAADYVQSLNSDGFQVGTQVAANTLANNMWYFGFKSGTNFAVGTYSGTGSTQNITSPGLQPDNIWIKATGATRGVLRTAEGATNSALTHINVGNVNNAITGILSNGFTVLSAAETNTSGTNNYRYVVWKNNGSVGGAAAYKMKTGYYNGNALEKSISGLGFSPELVLIKSDTTTMAVMFKTKYMIGNNNGYLGTATADSTAGLITLDLDGFTVNSTTNVANIRYTWVAFAGSDCSASGTFCVGSYTGNGTSPRALTIVGFQPDMVVLKRNTAVDGVWRSSSMGASVAQFFTATTQDTTGTYVTTLDSTGFTIGATANTSSGVYYFFAFKNVTNKFSVGSYTGNATDNTNITGAGAAMVPNFVFLKNANAGVAVAAVYNVEESYGDNSGIFTATANVADNIQALQTDGFQVGAASAVNGSGNSIFWAAFGGGEANSASGTFKMASGTYTGTGANRIIDMDFAPDLIIIKGDTTLESSFRTRMMGGDSTAYLGAATANYAGGVISINVDGFTLGTDAKVNGSGTTFYWTAYGNAWNPDTNSGAADFYIGYYYSQGLDNVNIPRIPIQADMVTIKRSGGTVGTFRTSAMVGDLSGFFSAIAEASDRVQSLNSDGFTIGANANVSAAATFYWYFGFKSGTNFAVGTYSGTGSTQNITSPGFQPDNIWVKVITATRGIMRNSNGATNSALPFINVANLNNAITGIVSNGFTVLSAGEANASGTNNYRYVAWRRPAVTVGTSDTQSTTLGISTTGNYVGAAFTLVSNIGTIDVSSITISETGTISASSNLSNVKLFYETTGSCAYDGSETQFGTTQAFSLERATFTGTIAVGSSQICVYPVFDIGSGASVGNTIEIEITKSTDISLSEGQELGTFPLALSGTTTLQAGINIVGVCKQFDETTNCSDSETISYAVNGSLEGTSGTTASGVFTITNVTMPSAGDVITVFADGVTDAKEAVSVTKYDGTSYITGILIYERHLTLGSDDNQTITNSDISQYDNSISGDEDIFNEVNASNDLKVDTINQFTDETLYVKASNTYRPDSTSSGDVLTVNLTNAGTLKGDGNAITVAGVWRNDDTFTSDTSTVNLSESQSDLTSNLVGYWNLDESATPSLDSSGNASSGTWSGNTTSGVGVFGRAASLDGADDYIDMGDPVSGILDPGSGSFTYTMWVNPTSSIGSFDMALYKGGSSAVNAGYDLELGSGVWFANISDGTTLVSSTVSAAPVNGSWSMLTVVVNRANNTVKSFFNGLQTDNDSIAGLGSLSNSRTLRFGVDHTSAFDYNGLIDEVRLYTRALTLQEITDLYNKTLPSIGEWPMEEGTGTSTADTSGNSFNGTLTNGPTWTTGKIGSALSFDGTDDIVDLNYSTNLNQFTIGAWINATTYGEGSTGMIINKRDAGSTIMALQIQGFGDNWLTFSHSFTSNIGKWNTPTSSLATGGWHYISVSYNNSSTSNDPVIYIDGSLQTLTESLTPAGTAETSTEHYYIGNNFGTTSTFNGKIDEVKIYNYIRTSALGSEDMKGIRGGYTINSLIGSTSFYNLIATGSIYRNIVFKQSDAFTITNNLTLTGTACASTLILRSSTIDTQWSLDDDSGGTTSINYVAVRDSNATDQAISVANGYNGTNNTNWTISLCGSNAAPNSASSLAQVTTSNVTINPGDWYNSASVKFTATLSDPDSSDTLSLCVEIIAIPTTFTNTETLCGSGVAYSGSPVSASVTISGITDATVYHWQARAKDSGGLYSSWVIFSATMSNLVGYWKMDESSWTNNCSTTSVADSSGNSNDGKACPSSTGPVGGAAGKIDYGGYFDGVNDYVDIADSATLTPANDLSVSLWMKLDTLPSITGQKMVPLYKANTVDPFFSYSIQIDTTDAVKFTWGKAGAGNSWSVSSSASAVTSNTWYHIEGTRSGATLKLYINGSLVSTNSSGATGTTLDSNLSLRIGASSSSSDFFKGYIDNVRIYDYLRNDPQVVEDMASGGDFGIDTTPPTGGTVYDGSSIGSDITFNAGSLAQLDANWATFNGSASGIIRYDYSVGTTPGGTTIKNWTSNNNETSVSAAGLSLQSSILYYVNIRANDSAGNNTVVSSNGQYVAPTLSFTISSNSINFDNLNGSNTYTDTETTTLTTSTNAFNGYAIKLYKTGVLTSTAGSTISDFAGGSYASPAGWTSANGFGYTSDDTNVAGVDRYTTSPTCLSGGSPPCYAPFSSAAPGDTVADHTATVSGTPVTSEVFTITYKVKTPSTQQAGRYTTTLIYTIIPQY